jgi:hypothetical protein
VRKDSTTDGVMLRMAVRPVIRRCQMVHPQNSLSLGMKAVYR